MRIVFKRTGKEKQVHFEGTAQTLLRKLKLNPEVVVLVKNASPITLDEKLNDTDRIDILSVGSAG